MEAQPPAAYIKRQLNVISSCGIMVAVLIILVPGLVVHDREYIATAVFWASLAGGAAVLVATALLVGHLEGAK